MHNLSPKSLIELILFLAAYNQYLETSLGYHREMSRSYTSWKMNTKIKIFMEQSEKEPFEHHYVLDLLSCMCAFAELN